MKPSSLSLIAIFSFLFLFGCQDILECVINRRPELPNKTLSIAHTNDNYYEVINAQIKNEPRDNDYYYYFSISHNLPDGMDVYVEYRSVIIEGYPSSQGQFYIDVDLRVEEYEDYYDYCENQFNDCDGLCVETTSKIYHLRIL